MSHYRQIATPMVHNESPGEPKEGGHSAGFQAAIVESDASGKGAEEIAIASIDTNQAAHMKSGSSNVGYPLTEV